MTPEAVKRATIEDVARRAGVSRAAVSKVIRDAYGVSASMRERVEAVIEELDYRPLISARGMRGATFTLGMELPDIANQFFARILSGATTALETEPYQLIIAPADPDHSEGYRALEALADRQVDGLIAVSPAGRPPLAGGDVASHPDRHARAPRQLGRLRHRRRRRRRWASGC